MIPVRSESFKPCKFHIEAVANSNGGNRLKWLSHNHISQLPFGNRCVTQHIVRIQTDFPRHYGCKNCSVLPWSCGWEYNGLSWLPAATKLGQGNVFYRRVSVHRGGVLPQCMLGYHPPGADPPGPGTPPPPGTRPPPGPGRPLPPPGPGRHPPGPGRHPPGSRLQNTVYERPVRILLECILVCLFYMGEVCKLSLLDMIGIC